MTGNRRSAVSHVICITGRKSPKTAVRAPHSMAPGDASDEARFGSGVLAGEGCGFDGCAVHGPDCGAVSHDTPASRLPPIRFAPPCRASCLNTASPTRVSSARGTRRLSRRADRLLVAAFEHIEREHRRGWRLRRPHSDAKRTFKGRRPASAPTKVVSDFSLPEPGKTEILTSLLAIPYWIRVISHPKKSQMRFGATGAMTT